MAYVGNTPFGPSCPPPTRVFAQVNTGFRSVRRSVGLAHDPTSQETPARAVTRGEAGLERPVARHDARLQDWVVMRPGRAPVATTHVCVLPEPDQLGPAQSRHQGPGRLPAGRNPMTKLQRLYAQHGRSPWLDNLTRGYLRDGTLARMVADGIRGVTANPTIFAKAIEGSADYDEQFSSLAAAGWSVEDAYWELVVADISAALAVLRPVFDAADGTDGFVSVEVAPELARDTKATIDAARGLHQRVDQPNLFVKIPATAQGVPAVEAMIAEGRSINITCLLYT